MPTVRIGDDSIFYVQRPGDDMEPSLVFVHGAGGTHRHWGNQLQGLRGGALYALDLPGHGRSGGEAERSIHGYAEFLLDFLRASGAGRATLVGHSMGGAIVQHLALNHASEVQGLILVGTGARLRVLPSLLEGVLIDFEPTVEALLGYAYSASAPKQLVESAREEWLANAPEVVHSDFLACDGFDVMQRLGEIRCPTLVLCGENDQLTPPKYSRYLEENVPDARLAIIPNAGHMLMLEQPERVNQAIEEFLRARIA